MIQLNPTLSHWRSLVIRFCALLMIVACGAGRLAAQQKILFNDNNFPDSVFRTWLASYITNQYPGAWSIPGQELKTTTLDSVLQDLVRTPQVASQVTDLRCMKWFPTQSCVPPKSQTPTLKPSVDLSGFPMLQSIDLSGWGLRQLVDGNRSANNNDLQFLRLKDCLALEMIEIGWLGRTDIFDLEGCKSLRNAFITQTEINHPTASGPLNYWDMPRFRYLGLESSSRLATLGDKDGGPREIIFGTYPQLTTLSMPNDFEDMWGEVTTFSLNNSLVTELRTGNLLAYTHNINVSDNRLENMELMAPYDTAHWNLDNNNFSHIEVLDNKKAHGYIIPAQTACNFNPGLDTVIRAASWKPYGAVSQQNLNNVTYDPVKEEISWNWGAQDPYYEFETNYSNYYLKVSIAQTQTIPLHVTLTSNYEVDPKTGLFVQRSQPLIYVLNPDPDPMYPNRYISDNIPLLEGPFEIGAAVWNKSIDKPIDEAMYYELSGSPKEATYNDEPETSVTPLKRPINGVLQPDWWPIVLVGEGDISMPEEHILQATTYFSAKPSLVPASIGAARHDIVHGVAVNASRANLSFTTFNTWTGTGYTLKDVRAIVDYIEGNPQGKLSFKIGGKTSIDEVESPAVASGKTTSAQDGWYDTAGRRMVDKPTAPGIYIHVQDHRATKLKI